MTSHEPNPSKYVRFTIPDFLKKYVEDADDIEDNIFDYKPKEYIFEWDTIRVKEYQITPEAYGVYFVYETHEGVIKHYKIDDFQDGGWNFKCFPKYSVQYVYGTCTCTVDS